MSVKPDTSAGTEPSEQRADAAEVERASTRGLPVWERLVISPQFLLLVVTVAFAIYVYTRSPQFLEVDNWINILRNAVFILIVGCFTTLVLVSGGLDLSIGSVFLVGAMATAFLLGNDAPIWLAMVLGVGSGALAGLVNGFLVNHVNIPAFITTLGMLYMARGLILFVTGSRPVAPLPDSFVAIGQEQIFGLPLLIVYALAVAVIVHVLLEHTPFGWSVRAIGGNREAARNSGIRVARISVIVYTLSGLSAALAGMLMSARLGSGQPSLGVGFELQVISAVIIGGTSLFGGIGSIPGTALGAVVLSVLTNGLILLRVEPVLENVAIGLIVVVAVGLDQLRRRRMFRTFIRR
jgi:ribose/xylose/arabinose/galactoside ABC-type transport system permease subunit